MSEFVHREVYPLQMAVFTSLLVILFSKDATRNFGFEMEGGELPILSESFYV